MNRLKVWLLILLHPVQSFKVWRHMKRLGYTNIRIRIEPDSSPPVDMRPFTDEEVKELLEQVRRSHPS